MKHENYLVTINVPPSLEEAFVDCLLSLGNIQGFSSYPMSAHDHGNQGLSIKEQVSGRQKRIRFLVYVEKTTLVLVITRLKTEFSGAGIKYWITPVIDHGVI